MTTTTDDQSTCCRHGVPRSVRGHDCAYTDLREALVPDATVFADTQAGPRPEMLRGARSRAATNPAYEAWSKAWNRIFFSYIDAEVRRRYQERKP